jgi:hypothetical protein
MVKWRSRKPIKSILADFTEEVNKHLVPMLPKRMRCETDICADPINPWGFDLMCRIYDDHGQEVDLVMHLPQYPFEEEDAKTCAVRVARDGKAER